MYNKGKKRARVRLNGERCRLICFIGLSDGLNKPGWQMYDKMCDMMAGKDQSILNYKVNQGLIVKIR